MKHLHALTKRIQIWFVSADKAYKRKTVYYFLCLAPVVLVVLSFELGPYDFESATFIVLLSAVLLDVSILMILFITHFIIFKITQAQQSKKEKHETKQAEEADEEEL